MNKYSLLLSMILVLGCFAPNRKYDEPGRSKAKKKTPPKASPNRKVEKKGTLPAKKPSVPVPAINKDYYKRIVAIKLSSDGKSMLLSFPPKAGRSGSVLIDVASKQIKREFWGSGQVIEFSPNEKMVVIGTTLYKTNHPLPIFDFRADMDELSEWKGFSQSYFTGIKEVMWGATATTGVSFSGDGKRVVLHRANDKHTAIDTYVHSTGTGKQICEPKFSATHALREGKHTVLVASDEYYKDGSALGLGRMDTRTCRLKKLYPRKSKTTQYGPLLWLTKDKSKVLHGSIVYDLKKNSSSEIKFKKKEVVLAGSVSPGNTLLALSFFTVPGIAEKLKMKADGKIYLYSLPSFKPKGVIKAHKRRVVSLAFSPDGKTLYSLGDDNYTRGWGLNGRKKWELFGEDMNKLMVAHAKYSGPVLKVTSLSFTKRNSLFEFTALSPRLRFALIDMSRQKEYGSSEDLPDDDSEPEMGAYLLWDMRKGKVASWFQQRYSTGGVFSPDGKRLYLQEKRGKVWEVDLRKKKFTLMKGTLASFKQNATEDIENETFSIGQFYVPEFKEEELSNRSTVLDAGVLSISPKGRFLKFHWAGGGKYFFWETRLWNTKSRKETAHNVSWSAKERDLDPKKKDLTSKICLAYTSNEKRCLLVNALYRVPSMKKLWDLKFPKNGRYGGYGFSPNDKLLLGVRGPVVDIHDLRGKLKASYYLQNAHNGVVAWMPDSRGIVVGSPTEIMVFSLKSKKPNKVFANPFGRVRSMRFVKKRLIALHRGGIFSIWDIFKNELLLAYRITNKNSWISILGSNRVGGTADYRKYINGSANFRKNSKKAIERFINSI